MARGFGSTVGSGTTDVIVTTLTAHADQRSFAFWFNRNGAGGNNQGRLFDKRSNGGSLVELCYFDASNGADLKLIYQRMWSTGTGTWSVNGGGVTATGTWNHVVITYDSTSTSNDPVIYINGVSQTVTEIATPSGTANTNTDPYHIGNLGAQSRVFDGQIADFAIWSRLLSGGEALGLGKGFSPLFNLPLLVCYEPLIRENVNEIIAPSSVAGTAVQPHPNTIYPNILQAFAQIRATSRHSLLLMGVGC